MSLAERDSAARLASIVLSTSSDNVECLRPAGIDRRPISAPVALARQVPIVSVGLPARSTRTASCVRETMPSFAIARDRWALTVDSEQ